MNSFLFILLLIAMGAVAYVLVRGVIAMANGKDVTGEIQQGYMQKRVLFQAIAIVIVAVIALVYWVAYRPLPQTSGEIFAPVSQKATVVRDGHEVKMPLKFAKEDQRSAARP